MDKHRLQVNNIIFYFFIFITLSLLLVNKCFSVQDKYQLPAYSPFTQDYKNVRDRFIDNFYYSGSIARDIEGNNISFGDQTIFMGIALMTFALEAKILNDAGLDSAPSQRLISEIISEYNVLDSVAPSRASYSNVPGFFMRDYIDGSRRHPALSEFNVDSDWAKGRDNEMSIDQAAYMGLGFWAVKHWSPVESNFQNRQKATLHLDNIVDFLKDERWYITLPNSDDKVERGEAAQGFGGFMLRMAGRGITGEIRINSDPPLKADKECITSPKVSIRGVTLFPKGYFYDFCTPRWEINYFPPLVDTHAKLIDILNDVRDIPDSFYIGYTCPQGLQDQIDEFLSPFQIIPTPPGPPSIDCMKIVSKVPKLYERVIYSASQDDYHLTLLAAAFEPGVSDSAYEGIASSCSFEGLPHFRLLRARVQGDPVSQQLFDTTVNWLSALPEGSNGPVSDMSNNPYWFKDNRWQRCWDDSSNSANILYNGLDYLSLYNLLRVSSTNLPPRTNAYFNRPHQSFVITVNGLVDSLLFASDPNGDQLTFTLESPPANGRVNVSPSGRFQYAPNFDFEGQDSILYRVVDPSGLFAIGAASFVVIPPTNSMIAVKSGTGDGIITSSPSGINCGPDCFQDFDIGTTVNLQAAPSNGSIFRGWDGSCSSAGFGSNCAVTVNSSEIIIAQFDQAPAYYELTLDKIGTGQGVVTSNLPGINCGDDCIQSYLNGSYAEVELIPRPEAGSVFSGWNGACSGTGSCKVTMYDNKKVTATFSTANPTRFLVSNANDSGPGSLRNAITDSNNNPGNDSIEFDRNISDDIILSGDQIEILDSVKITGESSQKITINGNNNSRIFRINPGALGTVVLDGLTITNGFDENGNGGGAILVENGTISIENCNITGNRSASGSGGGGIRKFGPGVVTIVNSSISGNSVVGDGGGGGLRNDQEKLTIINSTISGNRAASGGGIASSVEESGVVELINCTITNNTAVLSGGGIHNSFNELIISNSIISGNSAPDENEIFHSGGLFLTRGNNIFGENAISGISTNLIVASSDLILQGPIDTLINPLSNNGGSTPTHMILPESIATNNGNSEFIPQGISTDQRGGNFKRVVYTVDIGSLELTDSEISGQITGKVLDYSNTPLQDIDVEVFSKNIDNGGYDLAKTFRTNSSGKYSATNLTPGVYRVCFSDNTSFKFLNNCYIKSANKYDAQDITINPGETIENIDIRLIPGSQLSGVTISRNGSPITGVNVLMFIWDPILGNWVPITNAISDDSGKYIFRNIASGNYRLCFSDPEGEYEYVCFGGAPGENGFILENEIGGSLSDIDMQMKPAAFSHSTFLWNMIMPVIMNQSNQ